MPRVLKTCVSVDLPADFIDFMRQVAELIAAGDDSTTIESDDLLQCDNICGGLIDHVSKRFGFCYFRAENSTWEFVLNDVQIAAIVSGSLNQLELWRCSGGSCDCLYPTEESYYTHCDSIRHFDHGYVDSLRRWYPDRPDAAIISMANLRRIVLAILDYIDNNDGRMPPPFTTNVKGDRLHCWRSLILPFLDLDELYAAIDFDQPWNAAVNRSITTHTPDVFRSPGTAPGHTRYSAIVGPQTLWPPNAKRTLSDVKSGYSYTIAVAETPGSEFGWMEPSDIDLETLARQLASNNRSLLAAMIDGNTKALRNGRLITS